MIEHLSKIVLLAVTMTSLQPGPVWSDEPSGFDADDVAQPRSDREIDRNSLRVDLEEVKAGHTIMVSGLHGTAESATGREPECTRVFPEMGVRIAVEPIVTPIRPVRAEGGRHLFYELRLTSFDPCPLEVDSLQVLDRGSPPAVLASYGRTALGEMIESRIEGNDNPLRIVPGSQSVLFLWLEIESSEAGATTHLQHRFWLSHDPAGERERYELDTDPIPVSTDSALVIRSPLRGGPWYAHAGPANESHHRRTLAPRDGTLTMSQRFATDWLMLKEDAGASGSSTYTGPDWDRTLGAEVVAVADGRVVAAVDGIPDDPIGPLRPGEVISWETIGGNRITLDLGNGRFAAYQHLQNGSLRVQVGDTVQTGQLLGVIGNSGNSGAPHLHFGITDSETLGKGRGLPFVFQCFALMTRTEPMPGWGELVQISSENSRLWDPSLHPQPIGERDRRLETPLGGSVVFFRSASGGDGEACNDS